MHEISDRYRQEDGVSLIEIKLATVQQLFDSLDPSPFREKDMDDEAENYVVSAVREFGLHAPLKLVFHFPLDQIEEARRADLATSIHNYFDYRMRATSRDLRFQLRLARTSLVIGLAFLFACVTLRQLLFGSEATGFEHILDEGLLIVGWVAMWRPLEAFLYDWWPVRHMCRVYAKLAAIPIECRAGDGTPASEPTPVLPAR